MRHITLLASLALVSTTLLHCTADTADDSADIKKRTKPKAGMGAVLVQKPTWYDPALFDGEVRIFNSAKVDESLVTLSLDAQQDFVPGQYNIYFRPKRGMKDLQSYSILGFQWRMQNTGTQGTQLAAGTVWEVNPAGLRMEMDRPLVWAGEVPIASVYVPSPAAVLLRDRNYGGVSRNTEISFGNAPMASLSLTAESIARGQRSLNYLLPAETYNLAGLGALMPVTLTAGKLTTVPVKALNLAVALDDVDPAFPDAAPACAKMMFNGVEEPVRSLTKFKTAVLPEAADVSVEAFGLKAPSKVAGNVRTFTLNRLELDDVEVTAAGGGTQRVRGQARIEVKLNNTWQAIKCANTVKTSTALDLPDGTYRITSTATGPSGIVNHVEEVSFP